MFVFVIPNYDLYSVNQPKVRFGQGKEIDTATVALFIA
jgi:hypothetical protein